MVTTHKRTARAPAFPLRPVARAVLGAFLASGAGGVHAGPLGPEVSAGTGKINQAGSVTTVEQSSPRLSINWQSFSIGAGETVAFRQPSAQAIALNRVLGQDASVILGNLSANGQVFLLNPNGVLFGAGARVDVGGIVASTLGLSDADFMAGRYTFSGGGSGSVLNRGTIRAADGGYVALVGPRVANEGVVTARLGTVALGAGEQVTLRIDGQQLVGFSVDKAAVDALAANKHIIQADGGTVVLSAQAKDALLSTVVNNTGIVEARSVSVKNGVIRLEGGASGVVSVSGKLDASGSKGVERGGQIQVTGEKVALLDGAVIDASGGSGGGAVLVGGGFQGKNPAVQNASRTYVAPSATIRADAIDVGNGGKVIVWADGDTRFHGTISAKGGSSGGDGGSVEVSGKQQLAFDGRVDTSAARGAVGTLLLDPDDLTISAAPVGGALPAATNPFQAIDGINNYYVLASILTTLPAATAVQLQASNNIIFQTSLAMLTSAAGSITMTAANGIQMGGFDLSTAGGGVSMTAGAGGITNLGTINLGTGVLTLNASGAITQNAGDLIQGTTSLVKQGTGSLTLSAANTYTGTTTVSAGTLALGASNVLADGSSVIVNGGTLSLTTRSDTVAGVQLVAGSITGTTGVLTSASAYDLQSGTVSAILGGVAVGLNKTTGGTVTLSGANTYTGATAVNVGTLALGASNVLADTSSVVVNGGTLSMTTRSDTVAAVQLVSGSITGTSGVLTSTSAYDLQSGTVSAILGGAAVGLNKTTAGTVILSGANTYTGTTAINAGTLQLGATNVIANTSAVTVASGATFDLNSFAETVGSIAGAGSITLGTAILTAGGDGTSTTFSGPISGTTGGLTKAGAGVLTLSGINSYTGVTTISGGTLQASGGSAIPDTSQVTLANTAGVSLDLTANETIGNLSTGGAAGGNVTLNGNTLTVNQAAATTYLGIVSGAGGITKQGAGTLTLSGANTYTGATAVNVGTLALGASNVLADTSSVVVNGGTLSMTTRSDTVAGVQLVSGSITGTTGVLTSTSAYDLQSGTVSAILGGVAVGLNKTTAGTVTLSGANTYTGTTAVNVGTLALGASNVLANGSSVVVNGGTLSMTTRSDTVAGVQLVSGSITGTTGVLTSTSAYDLQSGTVSAILGGVAVGLNKTTGGTVILSGANTYTGTTAINAGTLQLSAANRIADTSAVTVASGATFDLNSFAETVGSIAGAGSITLGTAILTAGGDGTSTTFSGPVSGTTGGLTKAGAGVLTLSGINSYTGVTTVSGGTLQASGGSAIPDTSQVTLANTAGVSLDLTANETIGNLSTGGAAGGNVTLNGNTLTVNQAAATTYLGIVSGAGGITKQGAGTLTLSGANTYTGTTAVNVGTLALGASNVLADTSSVVVNGGTLSMTTRSDTVAGVQLVSGSITGTTGVLTSTSAYDLQSGTVSAILGGVAVGLNKTTGGTVTLSGANTYTGTTAVSAGTLRLGATNVIANASAVTVASGATFDLNSFAETVGSIAGAGNITLGTAILTAGGDGTSTTFSGPVSGTTGGLTKAGAGVLTLSGINSYTGVTTVSGGTLQASGGSAIPDTSQVTLANTAGVSLDLTANETIGNLSTGGAAGGNVTLNGNTLTVNQAAATTYLGIVSGAGGITKQGAGTLTLSGANTYTGATAVNVGTLALGASNVLADTSSVVVNGGTLSMTTRSDTVAGVQLVSGSITGTTGVLTSTSAYDLQSGTVSAILGGVAVGLNKTTAGTVTLSGANTYAGATTVGAGTLIAGNPAALGATAAGTTVANGATLQIANVAIGAEAVTLNGAGAGGTGALIGTGTASLGGAVTLASPSTIAASAASDSLTLGGAVNGSQALTQTGSGTVAFGNTVGATTPLAAFTSNAGSTTLVNGGLLRTTGAQLYDGALSTGGPATLQTASSDITANAAVTATAGTLTFAAGGGNVTMTNPANNLATVAVASAGAVDLVDANALALAASNAGTLRAQSLGGNITVNGPITASGAGDSIVLAAAGNFVNNAGAAALDPGPGRWLVWSTNPASDTRGGLAYAFKQYDATYGVTPVAGVGSGFLYSVAPSITPSLTGTVTKVYDGTTTATLTPGNYVASGAIDGDSVTLGNPASATYDTKDVGVGKNVAVSGLLITGVTNGAAVVYGYQLASDTANASIGTIDPATLTGSITAANKTYDGNNTAAITSRTLAGVIGGDTVSYVGGTATFSDQNVAVGKTVTATGLSLAGTGAGNYTVNTTATTTADITALGITGSITAANKTYDGNTAATITSRTLSGVIGGDTVSYAGGTATFSDPNVAAGKTVTATGLGLAGADAANYTVNSTAVTTANITTRPLTVTADAGQTKVYGNTDPLPFTYAVTSGSLVGGDSLSGALSRNPGENVGSYAIIQNTLTAGPNYSLAFVSNSFMITPATLSYIATPVSIFQGNPFPPFTGTVAGFKAGDTLASATTGTLTFTTTAPNSNFAGVFPIDGSGLSAHFGNYVFVQALANALALVIAPSGSPLVPGTSPNAYVGALASATQGESTCADLFAGGTQETLCGAQQNFRQSEQVNLVPGWRRVIELGGRSLTVEGSGIRLPAGARDQ